MPTRMTPLPSMQYVAAGRGALQQQAARRSCSPCPSGASPPESWGYVRICTKFCLSGTPPRSSLPWHTSEGRSQAAALAAPLVQGARKPIPCTVARNVCTIQIHDPEGYSVSADVSKFKQKSFRLWAGGGEGQQKLEGEKARSHAASLLNRSYSSAVHGDAHRRIIHGVVCVKSGRPM